MYRCEPCKAKCRGSMRRHVLRKPNNQIAREVPVCGKCHGLLADGVSYTELVATINAELTPREAVVVEVAPEPAEVIEAAAPIAYRPVQFGKKR